MSTPYNVVYNRFLSKLLDFDLVNLQEEVAEEVMLGYLNASCDFFTGSKKDLYKRNELGFEEDLSGFEITILVEGMLYEWIQPHINNILLMKQHLPDKDYKTYSQANHLRELQLLRDSYEQKRDRLMVQYSYENANWDFG